MKRTIAVLMTVLSLGLGGCASSHGNKRELSEKNYLDTNYLNFENEGRNIEIEGKVLIITTKETDRKVYTTLTLGKNYQCRAGKYFRNIALNVLGKIFTKGADHSNKMPSVKNQYSLIINPKIMSFEAGVKTGVFSGKPFAKNQIVVNFYDQNMKKIATKYYSSDEFQPGSFLSGKKGNLAKNQLAYNVLLKNVNKVVDDIENIINGIDINAAII